jgi:hypothetical protein
LVTSQVVGQISLQVADISGLGSAQWIRPSRKLGLYALQLELVVHYCDEVKNDRTYVTWANNAGG